ncbi:MAG: hypothetical protein ACOC93_01380 [Planctomycetota bacterium]
MRKTGDILAREDHRHCGAALLEVIFAVVLFASAGAVILGGVRWSMRTTREMRLAGHAADLAVTVMSRAKMGGIDVATAGPNDFDEPWDEWTWELTTAPADEQLGQSDGLVRVEVIIRRDEPSYTYRLVEWLPRGGREVRAGPAGGRL